jgi:UDP-N-acetylglucosamine diphosphorylase/glucosamine-1-phosphate N-acetyltransferase
MPLAIIILAAGKGKRMNNPEMAKVLYPVLGRPMIDHVLDRALELTPERVVLVVGHRKELVTAHVNETFGNGRILFAEQNEQLGTGHAVMQCADALAGFDGDVLVLSGDVPGLTSSTLTRLLDAHRSSGAACTMIAATLDDPTGYGRVVRNGAGDVDRIVEHKDASDEERAIREINTGIYLFNKALLFDALRQITPNNAQGEYYLTDVLAILRAAGHRVAAIVTTNAAEVMGVNTVAQLEELDRYLRQG